LIEKTYPKKLAKGEEKDWAWDLIGMTNKERQKTVKEKIEKWYSPEDVVKINKAFRKLAGVG
jgi:hypothetical protein